MKLKVIGASVAMALLVASPAAADGNGVFAVESEFLGTETVEFGGFEVESEFLFFEDGVFGEEDDD